MFRLYAHLAPTARALASFPILLPFLLPSSLDGPVVSRLASLGLLASPPSATHLSPYCSHGTPYGALALLSPFTASSPPAAASIALSSSSRLFPRAHPLLPAFFDSRRPRTLPPGQSLYSARYLRS
ncbi:hypothetical protein FB451DRAFT_1295334 [Mycena latifolia]|nr:hypothetical protein FB451DRAFT_1295334 [Mycena latifolia]